MKQGFMFYMIVLCCSYSSFANNEVSRAEYEKLFEQLGSDSYHQRRAAYKALKNYANHKEYFEDLIVKKNEEQCPDKFLWTKALLRGSLYCVDLIKDKLDFLGIRFLDLDVKMNDLRTKVKFSKNSFIWDLAHRSYGKLNDVDKMSASKLSFSFPGFREEMTAREFFKELYFFWHSRQVNRDSARVRVTFAYADGPFKIPNRSRSSQFITNPMPVGGFGFWHLERIFSQDFAWPCSDI